MATFFIIFFFSVFVFGTNEYIRNDTAKANRRIN